MQDPLYGALAGAVSMSGGHGSTGAFGKTVEQLGVIGASTMALSSATFGLLAGGLLGAPLALYLIRKNNLKAVNIVGKDDVNFEEKFSYQNIIVDELLKHIAVLSIIMMIGTSFSSMLKLYFDLALPSYVGAMFVVIIFNNLNVKYNFISLNRNLIDILGITSLNIFLSMALISLRLWELTSLAVPMFLILFAQVLFMAFFTSQIVFKTMGKEYYKEIQEILNEDLPLIPLYHGKVVYGVNTNLKNIAIKNNIPFQVIARSGGSTNGCKYHIAEKSIPTVVIGVPTRYIHTHYTYASVKDFKNAICLGEKILEELSKDTIKSF